MQKMKTAFSILILIFSVGLASLLLSTAASAQCTWMDGLSMVRGFNNVHIQDYRWQRVGSSCCDTEGTVRHCSLGVQSVPLCAQAASPANNPGPAPEPGVNNAIHSDTCPSAYDIDCYSASCPSCSSGGCVRAPG